MRKLLVALTLIGTAVALSGCGTYYDNFDNAPEVQVVNTNKVVVPGGDDIVLYTVLLSDSTKCVVSQGSRGRDAAVTCDWSVPATP